MSFQILVYRFVEYLGICTFSVSGAMIGVRKRLDFLGVFICAVLTSLGGGLIRDLILGNTPPAMFYNYTYVVLMFITTLVVFMIAHFKKDKFIEKEEEIAKINNIFDALGLGLYSVIGVQTAINAGYMSNPYLTVFVGGMTGVGGGMLRDALINDIPVILTKNIYILASLAGSIVYYVMMKYNIDISTSTTVATAVVFIIRMLATKYKWNMPKAF